jgi:Protein of unknown function (DUF3102)
MGVKNATGLLPVSLFDYSKLELSVAQRARATADVIRQRFLKTLDELVEIGSRLNAIRAILPHGYFGPWLKEEFGWSQRMAQNFMSVAEQFGPKIAIIANLSIHPTAAYFLAAPSVPDVARELAIRRADAGEVITMAVAKDIVTNLRHHGENVLMPNDGPLTVQLRRSLERFRDRWNKQELMFLIVQLREFADAVETQREKMCPSD